ncbi:MAG TPA: zinc-binding alcohol dehydrogenase family protein [Acidimicrobiales bacterium]|nr:zinc-binding alcohol dehydrogenase family protein [Acidimicrobiales bacterium]
MKAAVYDAPGGPEVLRYADVADPEPGDGDVLVQVEAISVEGGDTLARANDPALDGPHVVGYQAAGTVVEAGASVSRLAVGDRVVTVGLDGSHAELRAVPEGFCWPVPDGLDVVEAACVPIPFGTASDCLFEFGRLQAGETALVHAGASGVGIAAIQLASRAGATVLATASRDDKLARLAELGLDRGINYAEVDFADEVRRLTGGRGADVIVESVGGQVLDDSLRCLAYRGRCVSVGDAGRAPRHPLDVSGMRPNNQTLTGYFLGAELFFGDRAHPMIGGLLDDVAAGRLRVVVDRTYPLRDAAEAHDYIESRQAFGRVVLVP